MALACLLLAYCISESELLSNSRWGQIPAMNDGTAVRPFACRTLIPWIVQAMVVVTPASVQVWITDIATHFVHGPTYAIWRDWAGRDDLTVLVRAPGAVYPAALALAWMWLSLLAYAYAVRALARHFFPGSVTVEVAPIVAVIALTPFCAIYLKVYDFATPALMALCLLQMFKQRWRMAFFVFAIGCLNKETMVLALLAYAALHRRSWRAPAFRHRLLAFVSLWMVIGVMLDTAFGSRIGGRVEPSISTMLHAISALDLQDLAILFTLAGLIAASARCVPRDLALPALGVLAGNLLLFLGFGNPGEFRVFFDSFPLLTVMLTRAVMMATQSET